MLFIRSPRARLSFTCSSDVDQQFGNAAPQPVEASSHTTVQEGSVHGHGSRPAAWGHTTSTGGGWEKVTFYLFIHLQVYKESKINIQHSLTFQAMLFSRCSHLWIVVPLPLFSAFVFFKAHSVLCSAEAVNVKSGWDCFTIFYFLPKKSERLRHLREVRCKWASYLHFQR